MPQSNYSSGNSPSKPYGMNPYHNVTQSNKNTMYSRALRDGSQTQSSTGKKTGTGTGAIGGGSSS